MTDLVDKLSKYPQAVGPEYAAQLCLKKYIEDINNTNELREEALLIYGWLGIWDISIDEVFEEGSLDWGLLLLEIMEKYDICSKIDDSNIIMNYGDALYSLRHQNKMLNLKN
jgi:hypothetical protein